MKPAFGPGELQKASLRFRSARYARLIGQDCPIAGTTAGTTAGPTSGELRSPSSLLKAWLKAGGGQGWPPYRVSPIFRAAPHYTAASL